MQTHHCPASCIGCSRSTLLLRSALRQWGTGPAVKLVPLHVRPAAVRACPAPHDALCMRALPHPKTNAVLMVLAHVFMVLKYVLEHALEHGCAWCPTAP